MSGLEPGAEEADSIDGAIAVLASAVLNDLRDRCRARGLPDIRGRETLVRALLGLDAGSPVVGTTWPGCQTIQTRRDPGEGGGGGAVRWRPPFLRPWIRLVAAWRRDFTATPGGYPPSGYVPCGHSPLLFKWLHHSGYIIVVTS